MISNQQILRISESLREDIEKILQHFSIDYSEASDRFYCTCPIHEGDNENACSIYKSTGLWQCFTAGCHDDYQKTLIGFVRGVLSKQRKKDVSFPVAFEYCCELVGESPESLRDVTEEKNIERAKQDRAINTFNKKGGEVKGTISRALVQQSLSIPSQYYIKRGYSAEILRKFDIGECYDKTKPMFKRVVVPVYDIEEKYIGCSGRAIDEGFEPKWRNSKGFSKTSCLYGINEAKESIIETKRAFLVEGPGDVWRMHEAGFPNTLGMFGVSLSMEQLIILEGLPIEWLIIATDNDNAGETAYNKIVRVCGRRFNYRRLKTIENDIGDTEVSTLKELING